MLIKNMLEDVGDDSISQDTPIPIPNVRSLPAANALTC
jgi:S-phase kinase-associated protein 1